MPDLALSHGWSYRRKASAFSELGGVHAAAWQDIHVPHDAMIAESRRDDLPDGGTNGHFPTAAYQYRRTLTEAAELHGQLVSLFFEGVYQQATVFVNGTRAGGRPYGYSEFTARIDPYLRFDGTDEIMVECRTGKDARWYSGAGLFRPVHLRVKPSVHIDTDVRATTVSLDLDLATIEILAEIVNNTIATLQTRVRFLIQQDGETVATGDAPVTVLGNDRAVIRQRLFIDQPNMWSPDTPTLYNATVTLENQDGAPVDTQTVGFGMRTVQADPRHGLRINGANVTLRGACVHHDNGVLGAATFAAAEERRVRILKEAGFNAIRSAHNPMSRAMLDACDRIGMLVMDEAFDVWTISKTDEDYSHHFTEWWERDLEAMVTKDRNHPSVILYSIGNENPETGTPFGGNLSRKLAEKVRSLDPHRLVTNGVNGFVATLDEVLAAAKHADNGATAGGVNTMMAQLGEYMNLIAQSESVTLRTEEAQAVLDVAGMNYAESRYAMDRGLFPNRVIVGTESFPTHIATIWSIIQSLPNAIGDFTWTGWDYLGETGIGGIDYSEPGEAAPTVSRGYPWLIAFAGDIDITGHRRPASYYRETVFGLRTQPYIAVVRPETHGKTVAFSTPWAWSDTVSSWSWQGFEDRPVRVHVYTRASEVALLLDGIELDRQKVGIIEPYRADFDTTYRPGKLEAVAYHDGQETGRHMLVSADPDRRIQLDAEISGDGELVFVDMTKVDSRGTVIVGEDSALTLSIEGTGILQGLGSARPQTTESFTSFSHTTFDGRAFAVIRLTGDGAVQINATGEGLRPAQITIDKWATPRTGIQTISNVTSRLHE